MVPSATKSEADLSELTDGNVVRAFGAEHVQRLTALSAGQLRYWDATGFFEPKWAYENRRSPHSQIYSFKDVVGLRVLSVLRRDHKVSLPHLREVASILSTYSDTPWADTVLYVLNKQVYFNEPETGHIRGVVTNQYVALPLLSSSWKTCAKGPRSSKSGNPIRSAKSSGTAMWLVMHGS